MYYNLPYGARRINFQQEARVPNFTIATLYREREEERLLNNKGQFFVHLDEKNVYLERLVKKAQDLGLTVSGDGTAPVKGGDIREARKGDVVSFGSSTRFDVNWMARNEYTCKKGHRPIYSVTQDWDKIDKALKQFANEKKAIKFDDGNDVRFHSSFMMVNGRCIPYAKNEIKCLVPVQVLNNIMDEYEVIILRVRS